MHTNRRLTLGLIVLISSACAGDRISDIPTKSTPLAPAPVPVAPAVGLSMSPSSAGVMPAEALVITVNPTVVLSETQVARWQSSDSTVASLSATDGRTVRFVGLRPGIARITATLAGVSSSMYVTVFSAAAPGAARVIVESFEMIEFQYPGHSGWFYAPLISVREIGKVDALITSLDFVIPGVGSSPPCNAGIGVRAGATLDLFHEIYGDYQYEIGPAQATGNTATAILTVYDGKTDGVRLEFTGPIVRGGLPTTYTGGAVAWFCQYPRLGALGK